MNRWILSAAAVALCACEPAGQTNNDSVLPQAVRDLTAGSEKVWRLEQLTASSGDILPLPACDADNRYVFNVNGKYRFAGGEERCSYEKKTFDGVWEFTNNYKNLVIENEIEQFTKIYEIKSLSGNGLVWDDGGRLETLSPE
ncbi:MAG: lipocalin family protein [Bacteroidia bacterium]|nr:lipocalin family protein [Bacteroidia bacterium]